MRANINAAPSEEAAVDILAKEMVLASLLERHIIYHTW